MGEAFLNERYDIGHFGAGVGHSLGGLGTLVEEDWSMSLASRSIAFQLKRLYGMSKEQIVYSEVNSWNTLLILQGEPTEFNIPVR